MKRQKMKGKQSRSLFTRTAGSNPKNTPSTTPRRGGIRL